jgi:hypothetical protein
MEEPTATPIARSILFLLATVTAVTCSAALPTIGRMINPMKASLSPELPDTTALILSTMNSAQTATSPVEMSKSKTAVVREMFSSSDPAGFSAMTAGMCAGWTVVTRVAGPEYV